MLFYSITFKAAFITDTQLALRNNTTLKIEIGAKQVVKQAEGYTTVSIHGRCIDMGYIYFEEVL